MKKKPKGRGGARAGAGRPASGRRQVTLRLADATVDRLDRIVPERIGQARVIDAAVERLTDKEIRGMSDTVNSGVQKPPRGNGPQPPPSDCDRGCETTSRRGAMMDEDMVAGQSPFDFARSWYREEEIIRTLVGASRPEGIPDSTRTEEFGKWLAEQYALAMAKGIQIGERFNVADSPKRHDEPLTWEFVSLSKIRHRIDHSGGIWWMDNFKLNVSTCEDFRVLCKLLGVPIDGFDCCRKDTLLVWDFFGDAEAAARDQEEQFEKDKKAVVLTLADAIAQKLVTPDRVHKTEADELRSALEAIVNGVVNLRCDLCELAPAICKAREVLDRYGGSGEGNGMHCPPCLGDGYLDGKGGE